MSQTNFTNEKRRKTGWVISPKLYLFLGVLGMMLFPASEVSASHVVGSDITYKCTGNPGEFEVTLIFYRDCRGIGLDVSQSFTGCQSCSTACTVAMSLYGADPGCSSTKFADLILSLVSVRDVNVNPECPNSKNTCTNLGCYTGPAGTYTPPIERYEFKGTVNIGPTSGIPASCCNVRFAYSVSARNGVINTGSAGQNFYMDAVINRCLSMSPCNSSPELSNDPFAIMCGGDKFVFNNGAIDPDHDSLSYKFAPALQAFDNPVNYDPPFAYNKPMPWTGPAGGTFPAGISCDPVNGDIMFQPGNTSSSDFYGVMAVEIKQWKYINGVATLIGTTRRDIQMVVLANCPPNNSPTLKTDPPNGSAPNVPKTKWEICAGEQLCFSITAKDTDLLDTTYLSWNKALQGFGATFLPAYNPANRKNPDPLIGGPREDVYNFCWTPTEAMASSIAYFFTVSGKDNRCPNPARVTRAFEIKVHGRADLTINKTDLHCGNWQLSYTDNTLTKAQSERHPPSSVIWQVSSVPGDFNFSQSPYTFTAKTPPLLSFKEGGKYLVMLQASTTGPGGIPCTRIFYDTIKVDTVVQPQVRDTIVCRGKTVQISAKGKYGIPPYTYYWYNNLGAAMAEAAPLNGPNHSITTLTVNTGVSRYYTVKVKDLNGCFSFDSVKVTVKELPIGALSDSIRLCHGDTQLLDPGTNNGNIKRYLWNVGDTTQTITRNDSGQFIVELTDTFGCQQTDTMQLKVNRQIFPDAGPDANVCSGDSVVLIGNGGQLYEWRELPSGTTLLSKGATKTVKVSPPKSLVQKNYKYALTVFTSYANKECSVQDTVTLTVKPIPVLTRPAAVQVCRSEKSNITMPAFPADQAGTGVWSYPPSPFAIVGGLAVRIDSLKNIPKGDTTAFMDNWIYYTYTSIPSMGGCINKDSAKVTVYGVPKVDAGPTLQWCKDAGVYSIVVNNQHHSPSGINGVGEDWIGSGVSMKPGPLGSKRFYFDPTQASSASNIITYKYTLTYHKGSTNEISCINQDTVLFNVTTPPVIEAGGDVVVCQNEQEFVIESKQPGVDPASTTPITNGSFWTTSSPAIAGALKNGKFNPADPSINFTGSSKFYWLVYNNTSTGCPVKDSMKITVASVPDVALFYTDQFKDSPYVCLGRGTQVYFTPKNGGSSIASNTNVIYGGHASFGANPASGVASGVFNSTTATAGTYVLTMTYTNVTPQVQCSNTATTTIIVQDPPTIGVTVPAAICSYDGSSPMSLSVVPAAGYTYIWKTSGNGSYSSTNTTPTTYTIGSGDITAGQVILTAETDKRLTLGGNGDQCVPASDSKTLTIVQAPTSSIVPTDPEGCVPHTAMFAAGPAGVANVTYKWEWENESRNEGNVSSFSRTVETYNTSRNGVYRLRLTVSTNNTAKACSTMTDWTPLITHAVPEARFIANPPKTTIARPFFDFINQSSVIDGSGLKYLWDLGPMDPNGKNPKNRFVTDVNPTNVEYAADTAQRTVWLTAISEHGCMDSFPLKVEIEPDITVFIPNAFRPLGSDGAGGSEVDCPDGDVECNRTFKVAANGHMSIEIFVYDRWGQKVFESKSAEKGWNGRVLQKGELCPQDVYVYQVNATSFSGKKYKYAGTVTLLR
jgi:hypothetical protein